MSYAFLLLAPTLVLIFSFIVWHKKYTLAEVAGQFVVQALLIGIVVLATYFSSLMDINMINGEVIKKEMVRVACKHSYPCNCVSVSCGKDCTTTVCQTCYLHAYDQEWRVYSNIGKSWNIHTLDAQGLKEPPRWTAVVIGEPVTTTEPYKNYLKHNPDALMLKKGYASKFKGKLPKYPSHIYDYYHCDRVISLDGVPGVDKTWSRLLEQILRQVGPAKQCNIVVVIGKDLPHDFFYALQEEWINGKKNDVIPVISVDENMNIQWVEVMSLAKYSIINVRVRDNLLALKKLERDTMLQALKDTILQDYIRLPMQEFEYLNASKTLTGAQFLGLSIFSLLLSIGLSIFCIKNDVTD